MSTQSPAAPLATPARTFMLSGAMALAGSVTAWILGDGIWAARFAFSAAVLSTNFYFLSLLVIAATRRDAAMAMLCLLAKLACMGALFAGLWYGGLEVTSFLAGMSLSFVAHVAMSAAGARLARARAEDAAVLAPLKTNELRGDAPHG